MDFVNKVLEFAAEAAKVLHMDQSHSAIRDKLQRHLATQHRIENPDSDYYGYPSVQDVYGDHAAGQVVYSKNGAHTMADYSAKGDTVELSKHKAVKKSYVAEALLTQESEVHEQIEVMEAALDKNGKGEICLIKPCRGSRAVYSAESLQKTAANKAFPNGTQMFLDHQTAEERNAQPEGSVLKLAAVTEGDAQWKNGKAGWGLYAPIKAYSDFVPFINERAKDIGISVRGSIVPTGRIIDGLPEAQEFARGLSVDFVTRAGAGGTLVSVYESYRREIGGGPLPGTQKEGVTDVEVKEADFNALKAQADLVPKLIQRLDRVEETNRRFAVRDLVSVLVKESGLPARAQERIAKPFNMPTYNAPVKDDLLDTEKLTAAVKEAIVEETKYLQESGIIRLSPVRKAGSDGAPKEQTEEEMTQEADTTLTRSIRELSDLPPLSKTA